MEKNMKNNKQMKGKNTKFTKVILLISCILFLGITLNVAGVAEAAGGGGVNADTLWTTISDLIKTWVTRLGGVVMFVGGIIFGLGWKSDDSEQKSRGISTIIAGAIVIAVAALTSTFFA